MWESMKSAWQNHPYIIMGVGGVIVVYFLWPSKTPPTTVAANTDYASQLAAETSLSQAQIAAQTQLGMTHDSMIAAETAAAYSSVAASNQAISAANAAALISENQTTQAGITAQGNLAIAQTMAGSTDFGKLVAGLMDFGQQSEAGATDASRYGLDAYLAGLGAVFSQDHSGLNITGGAPGTAFSRWFQQQGSGFSNFGGGTAGQGLGGTGWGYGVSGQAGWGGGGGTYTGSPLAVSYLTDVQAAQTPFAASDNLLGALWNKMISQYGATQADYIHQLPAPVFTPPVLAGDIQPLPPHVS